MRKFISNLTEFFRGRYGLDSLSYFLVILSVLFSVLALFFLKTVFYTLNLIIYAVVIFRALSTNFVLRSNENRAFTDLSKNVKSFFALQKRIFKDRKTHVYRACPKCKATLRLPKSKGKHTVKCPKCSEKFEVKI